MAGPAPDKSKRFADRPPRIQPELPSGSIPIPKPPDDDTGQTSIIQALFPIITIIGYVAISFFGQGRNLLFIIPMGLSVGISSGFTIWSYYNNRRLQIERKQEYDNILAEMRREMVASHDTQRSFYEYNYPDPEMTMRIDGSGKDSRAGSRLWERRTFDHDFSMIRIGVGSRPSTVVYELDRGENEESPQMKDAIKLSDDSRTVFDVPITLPLYDASWGEEETDAKVDIRHAVGVAGSPEHVYPMMYAALANYVALHGPNDTHLYVTGVHQAEEHWDWLYEDKDKSFNHAKKTPQEKKAPRIPLIPHFAMPKSDKDAAFFPIRFEDAGGKHEDREQDPIAKFWKLLRNELERRDLRLQDDAGSRNAISFPFLLVIVDLLETYDPNNPDAFLADSLFRDVEAEAAVSTLLNKGQAIGAAVIFLVPARQKVPSGCTAVIEVDHVPSDLDRVDFRYAEIGLNTPRYVGRADRVVAAERAAPKQRMEAFARKLNQWAVRRSYGEGIPDAVPLLALNRTDTVQGLDIPGRWQTTKFSTRAVEEGGKEIKPAADWLRVPMGIMSNDEIRRLYFKADGDGVHGMVAGATGSGKSELLMTMILGLAIDYDPSIVNFGLIDYKGGAAFEPFQHLPHKVDIVTNLGGAAVNRMFRAVQAEMNRRQAINTITNSKHIVDYRARGLHLLSPEDFKSQFGVEKEPYPHLFIIVDEFAEMMEGNPEFKEQLNSITRLGRALGVVLILAAQRPTGVTDQMRANIKMKLSLRVETREESSEMLRRPDAAYLPPGIPGRGYLQIGNENLELLQVAWSGAKYKNYKELIGFDPDKVDWKEYAQKAVVWPDRMDREYDEPPALFEVLVEYMNRLTREDPAYQKQLKPWPDPLPRYMPLGEAVPEEGRYLAHEDRLYLEAWRERMLLPGQVVDDTTPLTLSAAVRRWLDWDPASGIAPYLWKGIEWQEEAMTAIIGLIDDASNAKQRLLWASLRRGHLALFGASGWGKTTFLRALIANLVSAHSPEEMHIFIMDFGGRQLEILRDLPHVGSIIRPDETEKIDRLVRWLDDELERRKQVLSEARTTNSYSYNANIANRRKADPSLQFIPSILVVIDNFAEIRENMDDLMPPLMSLAREGLSAGIHFVATGETPGTLGKLFNLFTERMTLKLADSADYPTVVGRGVPGMEETAGRGFVAVNRTPLEFQSALAIGVSEKDRAADKDETTVLGEFVQKINRAWLESQRDPSVLPLPIKELPEVVTLESVLDSLPEVPDFPASFVGIDDRTLGVAIIDHKRGLPHFIVTGQQQTGKTTTMRSMVLSIALNYPPTEIAMVLVDRLGHLFGYGGKRTFADLPHVIDIVTEPEHLSDMMMHLDYEYRRLEPSKQPKRDLFIFIDNYDDINELKPKMEQLVAYTRTSPERPVLHFIVSGSDNAMRSMNDFLRRISRYGMAMDNKSVQGNPFNATLKRNLREGELPLGRAFVVRSGKASMLQVAMQGGTDRPLEEQLDAYVEQVQKRYANMPRATWVALPVDVVVDPVEFYSPYVERILEIMAAQENTDITVMKIMMEDMPIKDLIESARYNGALDKLDAELAQGGATNGSGSNGSDAAEPETAEEETTE